mgnify:CR=1 FL=1
MKLNKIETAEENASFFYSLNNEDSNHWYFLLEVGKDNKGLRLSCEQEILIAWWRLCRCVMTGLI